MNSDKKEDNLFNFKLNDENYLRLRKKKSNNDLEFVNNIQENMVPFTKLPSTFDTMDMDELSKYNRLKIANIISYQNQPNSNNVESLDLFLMNDDLTNQKSKKNVDIYQEKIPLIIEKNVDPKNVDNGNSNKYPKEIASNHDCQTNFEPFEDNETSWSIALQICIPYLIAGFGTVGAGMVLDIVQHWPVFIEVTELFILVPALLGLKGNLEMTLASRLSTQANLTSMNDQNSGNCNQMELVETNQDHVRVDNHLSPKNGGFDNGGNRLLMNHNQSSAINCHSCLTPDNETTLQGNDKEVNGFLPRLNSFSPGEIDDNRNNNSSHIPNPPSPTQNEGALNSSIPKNTESFAKIYSHSMVDPNIRDKLPPIVASKNCANHNSNFVRNSPNANKIVIHKSTRKINVWPSLIAGNLALIQAQAAVIGLLASFTAIFMGWIPEGRVDFTHAKLLCASSILTASLASAILGLIMILVVFLSRKCHLNPDNIATPIAASLGDLITLSLLGFISKHVNLSMATNPDICYCVVCLYAVLTPIWVYVCYTNPYTRDVVLTGWSPIIFSMLISSMGGFILDFAVHRFKGIAVFQPVMNGVGGNLAAIQASRLSTQLHAQNVKSPATCHTHEKRKKKNFIATFCGPDSNSRTSRILLALVVPGHLIFIYTIAYMKAGHTSITLHFAFIYITAALIQVVVLLYITERIVASMWARGVDPDNAAIPYITAIGDMLGTGLLAIAFWVLWNVGDKDADLGD
ncbi:solute carrier family 41 member 1-like isoform X2 [Gordionus sp. m RMFG-2023]|uniref:solute carrier family 41 member 1-like isoform X2 n=1 Tax=Gordionus sp. m RMFG-2023 TaxID=3053472 RepID=UPI0031FCCB70